MFKITNKIFYVGVGNKQRVKHMKRNRFHREIVNSLPNKNFIRRILYENIAIEKAWRIERQIIKKCGRLVHKTGYLSNIHDGGPLPMEDAQAQHWLKGKKIKDGEKIAILSLGHPGNLVTKAIEQLKDQHINPAHYDMRFVKPIDEALLHEVFSKFNKIITVEDGCVMGGMGSAVIEFMADNDYNAKIIRLGIPDKFIEHGEQMELYDECGFSPNKIVETVVSLLKDKKNEKSKRA
jgi:transketolase C-terminal domain/subunit